MEEGDVEDMSSNGLLSKFFEKCYVPCIKNKPVAIALIVIFTGVFVQGAYYAFNLETPKTQEQWFAKDHMSTGFMESASDDYLAGANDGYVKARVVFGVKGVDRSKFVKWYPSRNRGRTVFMNGFDISTTAAQAHIIKACETLQE